MASREEIERAKRHFENPGLLESIRSGVLSGSYDHALTLLDALTTAEEERDRLLDALRECETEIDNYIDAYRPPGLHPKWDVDNAEMKAMSPARLALQEAMMSEAKIYYDEMLKLREQNDRLREALSLVVSILPEDSYLDSEERKIASQARAALQEDSE